MGPEKRHSYSLTYVEENLTQLGITSSFVSEKKNQERFQSMSIKCLDCS